MVVEKTNEVRNGLTCKVYKLNSLKPYKYVVICSWYQGQWLLSRHKHRQTWETQGDHIEVGETPLQAARRELYEESGVKEADIYPVCDYHGIDARGQSYGQVFLAVIRHLGDLPESEMKEAALFRELPAELTYPKVTPLLMAEALGVLQGILP